jgi:hypothetical protein
MSIVFPSYTHTQSFGRFQTRLHAEWWVESHGPVPAWTAWGAVHQSSESVLLVTGPSLQCFRVLSSFVMSIAGTRNGLKRISYRLLFLLVPWCP